MPSDLPTFLWNLDNPQSRHGEGVSRPVTGKRTKEYKLRVKGSDSTPMIITLKAENEKAAVMYCQNRWPEAAVQVMQN